MSDAGVTPVIAIDDKEPQSEVIDLTADDSFPQRRRKAVKREREKEFMRYLYSLDPNSRSKVRKDYNSVVDEKDDIIRIRAHFVNQPEPERLAFYNDAIPLLDAALVQLDEIVFRIRSGKAAIPEIGELANTARRKAKGVRGRIESMRQERAIKRLQQASEMEARRMILNDPSYIQSRSESMVTSASTTTNGRYRPEVNPPESNRAMLHRAFQDPLRPGILPDGGRINSNSYDSYANGLYEINPSQPLNTNTEVPYTQRVNSGLLSYNDNDDSVHHEDGTQHFTKNYEELVDLALTEAEALDLPPQMNCTTLEHQRQGLGWLMRAERGRNRGGILADDMGLGKTVQTIALLYANQPKVIEGSNDNRLVLVVCPVALISTWADELKSRVQREHWLRVYIHHKGMNGKFLSKASEIEENADIVICTYQGIVNEYKQLQKKKLAERERFQNEMGDQPPVNYGSFPLLQIKWHRVILDEAHLIKNQLSQMSIAVSKLHSRYRLALTGTPMQNRIEELYALIRFLHIAPYSDWTEFRKLLPPEKTGYTEYNSQKPLAAFLSAVMLRRRKDTLINGKKIIDNLPPKHVKDVNIDMEAEEHRSYKNLEKYIRDEVHKLSKTEEATMSNMLVFLLRMRQASCHPYLSTITKRASSHKVWGNNKYTRAAVNVAMMFPEEIRKLPLDIPDEERICSECDGDARYHPDTFVMNGCGHVLCTECSSVVRDSLSSDESDLKCPLCNHPYKYLANLEILDVIENNRPRTAKVALELLLMQQKPRVEELRAIEEERKRKLEEMRSSVGHLSQDFIHSYSPELFDDSETDTADTNGEEDEDEFDSFDEKNFPDFRRPPRQESRADTPATPAKTPSDDPLEFHLDINDIAKLFKIPGIFDEGWVSSAKVNACLDILRQVWREAPDDKVILFTSFTSLIDVLTIPLEAAQIPHAAYTGKMNVQERNATLDEFRRGRCKVLLASLKAGNVGLTLTQANRVIIVEPFWNPYVEDQAQDRVYRIGQSREVTIYRIRIKDTVEDRIVTLQDNKRTIIESALDNGMKTRAQGLSRTDIMYALGLRSRPRPVEAILRAPGDPESV